MADHMGRLVLGDPLVLCLEAWLLIAYAVSVLSWHRRFKRDGSHGVPVAPEAIG